MRLRKRNIIGSIVFGIGIGAIVAGLIDSNLVRIVIGLLLMVTGISVLFSRTDREASRHARMLVERFITKEYLGKNTKDPLDPKLRRELIATAPGISSYGFKDYFGLVVGRG